MSKTTDLLPARRGETDEERRMREAINRTGENMLTALDSAMRLRTAPSDAQRVRHMARGHLVQFAALAAVALALSTPLDPVAAD